jgi:hypothetical protein
MELGTPEGEVLGGGGRGARCRQGGTRRRRQGRSSVAGPREA